MAIGQVKILQTDVMTSMIESFTAEPKLYILNSVFKNREDAGSGEVVKWDEVIGSRKLAKFKALDGPHPQKDLTQVKQRTARLAAVGETRYLPGSYLLMARNPGTANDKRMEAKVTKELADMRRAIDRTVEWACIEALKGSLAVDQSTHPTHKVKFTVTYPVQTFDATADWDEADTKILTSATEYPALKDLMIQNAGMDIVEAILNHTTSRYFINNTEVKSWVSDKTKDRYLEELHFKFIDGITYNRYDHGYVNDSDTYTKYLANGKIIFLPEDRSDFVIFDGDCLIPENMLPGGSGVDGIAVKNGYYSYAKVTDDPVGIRLYAGRVFLPVIKNPSKVIYADVKKS